MCRLKAGAEVDLVARFDCSVNSPFEFGLPKSRTRPNRSRENRMQPFDQIEWRFASQARIWTSVVGLTGFYMLYRFDVCDRFRYATYCG
jgi:hypothetical protein